MDHNCPIIRDLLPLYIDGLTSPETGAFIEAHVRQCPDCHRALDAMRTPEPQTAEAPDYKEAVTKEKHRLRRKHRLTSLTALVLGVALCLGILYSRGTFSILAKRTSCEGTATVYAGHMTTLKLLGRDIPLHVRSDPDTFTLVGEIDSPVHHSFRLNAAQFRDLSWSPEMKYILLTTEENGQRVFDLLDLEQSPVEPIRLPILQAIAGSLPDEDLLSPTAPEVWISFSDWSNETSALRFYYDYEKADGVTWSGFAWYDPDSQTVTSITHEFGRG